MTKELLKRKPERCWQSWHRGYKWHKNYFKNENNDLGGLTWKNIIFCVT